MISNSLSAKRHIRPFSSGGRGARRALLAGVGLLLMAACSSHTSLLPPSGGKLYEVLVVGDTDDIVRSALEEDVPGLPQSEPQFDVSAISHDRFNQSVSMARNIVVVSIDPQAFTTVRLRYEKNVWAEPQMVVRVNAPSAKVLRDSMSRIAPTMLRLLNRSETNKSIALLRNKRNVKAEKLVKKMFGIDLRIPVDMTSAKRGHNFLWLSNNSPTVMKNIVVYRSSTSLPAYTNERKRQESVGLFCNIRDSILGANIKGETDSMKMQTVRATVTSDVAFKRDTDRQQWLQGAYSKGQTMLFRGLWEMTGDDMGGPFVSTVLPSRKGKETVAIEGFVFAPGKRKRNAIRQLEAVLFTAGTTN